MQALVTTAPLHRAPRWQLGCPPSINLEYASSTISESPPLASNDWLKERSASAHFWLLSATCRSLSSELTRISVVPADDLCGCQLPRDDKSAALTSDRADMLRLARLSWAAWASRIRCVDAALDEQNIWLDTRARHTVCDICALCAKKMKE